MTQPNWQDAQIFKERCEDSPGILLLCQGDWRPTPERVLRIGTLDYRVITAANGFQDIVDWLPFDCCMGAIFAQPATVEWAKAKFPKKVIERFEGVGARFLRTLTQELPYGLHNAGAPFDTVTPQALKTVDVVSVFSPVPLKRGDLLIDALLASGASAYLFAQSLGSNPDLLAAFLESVQRGGHALEYLYYPFDPYAVLRIAGRIVIDGRPIGANNSLVSSYLARSRLYVHTSTTEGLSNSVMEALMSDVPVLLCEDIRGPLHDLSRQLPGCFSRSRADAASLAAHIKSEIQGRGTAGNVRKQFLSHINPFDINRKVVRQAQQWFADQGLPWKGHCLGLLGGVQSHIDLNEVSATIAYKGGRHIYPSASQALACLDYQLGVADQVGNQTAIRSLEAERAWISAFVSSPPVTIETAVQAPRHDVSAVDSVLASLCAGARLRSALVIGAGANPAWTRFVTALACVAESVPTVCLESDSTLAVKLQSCFANHPSVVCLHSATVASSDLPSEDEISTFYAETPSRLRQYPLAVVIGWLRNDRHKLSSGIVPTDGIIRAHQAAKVTHFDLVIIDGMEFTGRSELDAVGDCRVIVLACTRTFKNWSNFNRLARDKRYELAWSDEAQGNGIAVFRRKAEAAHSSHNENHRASDA